MVLPISSKCGGGQLIHPGKEIEILVIRDAELIDKCPLIWDLCNLSKKRSEPLCIKDVPHVDSTALGLEPGD